MHEPALLNKRQLKKKYLIYLQAGGRRGVDLSAQRYLNSPYVLFAPVSISKLDHTFSAEFLRYDQPWSIITMLNSNNFIWLCNKNGANVYMMKISWSCLCLFK